VFVAVGIERAMRMRHTAMWPAGCTLFFHISKRARFLKTVLEHQMCVLFSLKVFFLKYLSFSEELGEI
jgi:hypothetical protein